jgi:hypothetical protein
LVLRRIYDAMVISEKNKSIHVPFINQVGSAAAANNETANTMMQKFWDSAMALSPNGDDEEARRLDVLVLILC